MWAPVTCYLQFETDTYEALTLQISFQIDSELSLATLFFSCADGQCHGHVRNSAA